MTNLLLRLFVKDYENAEDPRVHSAIGNLAGITGILCNCVLAAGKLLAGWLVNSVSIVADAVNNLSDAGSSVVTLLGFRLAKRPADRDHPYGHARYEYLSGLVVAALILLVGVELVKSSVSKILHPVPVEFTPVTFGILLCSVGLKLWMTLFYASLGKRIRSATLRAASADSRNDVIATTAVLVGGVIGRCFSVSVDGYIGLAVALFIIFSGVGMIRETISPILGQQADTELEERLGELVLSHEKVLGIHDLLVHDYGPGQYYASVHVEMDAGEDPMLCHDVIDGIEREALEQLHVNLVIHFDPVLPNDAEWNRTRQMMERIAAEIDPRLSIHDFRMAREGKHTRLTFDLAVPYELADRCQEIEGQIDQRLWEETEEYTTVIRFDQKG